MAGQLLGVLQRLRRLGGQFRPQLQRLVAQLVVAAPVGHQTHAFRLVGGQGVAGEQQAVGVLAPQQGRQNQAGAGFRHQAQVDEGGVETGAVRGDHQIAVQQQGGADAGGVAVHRRDHRLVQLDQPVHQIHRRALLAVLARLRIRVQEVADVVAGGEGAALGVQQQGGEVVPVPVVVHGAADIPVHLAAQGVELVGPVQGHFQ